MRSSLFASLAAVLPALVRSLSPTDEYQDADVPQSGYLPNHNLEPATLSTFKLTWSKQFNTAEVFYAKPLTYTPSGYSSELVILASNQNVLRVLDGLTGTVLFTRILDPPFQASDSQCGDIPNMIGITGTPLIDPATDIMYFYSKGYKNGATGPVNTISGQYKLYAVKIPTLEDVAGFPVSLEGHFANNDNTRYFVGGTVLQRPGLAVLGDSIVAGFGGHCDNFNYTGMLVTASKTSGKITNVQAMVASPGAPSPQPTDITVQQGGKAGIWASGMGIAVDAPNNRVFFATGNGRGAGVNGAGLSVSGKIPISTLEQVVANFAVDGAGGLTQKDYFEPYEYDNLNGADKDFGSSGVTLLDPNPFSGGGVSRLAVAAGKNGKVYVMDADNLGGFKMGSGGGDGVLQTITYGTSFFGGVGSYPLEGGYIYVVPTSDSLYAYKFGFDANGKPVFTQAGKTALTFAGQCVPTVTSLNGKAGSGIVWLSDINQGLVAYNAVPVGGVLQPITIPSTGRLTKFQRPSFGNQRVYTSSQNKVYGLGPPVAVSSSSSSVISSTSKATSSSSTSTSKLKCYFIEVVFNNIRNLVVIHKAVVILYIKDIVNCVLVHFQIIELIIQVIFLNLLFNTTGKLRTYNWNITWVRGAPDGVARPFVGINGQWPCPPLEVNLGDTIKINVYNALGNESTAIHFHGIFQEGTNFEDGPAMVTQCPIPPGEIFVYQFKTMQSGTYWYHAHIGGQYIDGFRGPLIIKDPAPPYGKVDQELTLTLSDVYHQEAPYLIHNYLSSDNTDTTGGAEPVPDSALINEAQNVKFSIAPGKTYLFHIINMGALAGMYLQFDQHTMTVVEVDGVFTQPKNYTQLFVAVAQRYSVIVQAKADSSSNFAIVASMNTQMFGEMQPSQGATVTGWLVYDAAKSLPTPFALQVQPFDDSVLVPYDQTPLFDPPSQTIYLTASFGANINGSTRALWNGLTYVSPKVPTLYSALTAPDDVITNPSIYGTNTNPFVLPYGAVVELDINNHDDRGHPFHLHGHNFQVIWRSDGGANFPGLFANPAVPMRRDTVVIYAQGSATIRFVADNPGIQLFHCHSEWHVEAGLTATFVEAPAELKAAKPYIPVSHRDVCDKHGIARKGNAAGNNKNWLDLTGQNTDPPANYWGALVNPPA
ncbi:WSC domain-containing protein [Pleurostoma richardsiae]|uniref:WSC domain-containing protein n=1 Tax=Pleurostoma richardsiae TaxID=41990 RepID=A0AA38RT60_9PEZI|nr:WSC domain-containing protein [Pleurostoma richardsiae]